MLEVEMLFHCVHPVFKTMIGSFTVRRGPISYFFKLSLETHRFKRIWQVSSFPILPILQLDCSIFGQWQRLQTGF